MLQQKLVYICFSCCKYPCYILIQSENQIFVLPRDFLFLSFPEETLSFSSQGMECKISKSRNTWNNRQVWFGVQKEAEPKLTDFAKRTHWSYQTPSSNKTRKNSTHGHHQMLNTEFRLIIFFAAKDGEAQYSQEKQDSELTAAQIISSLFQNSDVN